MHTALPVLLLILFGICAPVAWTEPPPLEAYGALPLVSDAEISPDGSKVAVLVNSEVGGEPVSAVQVLTLDREQVIGAKLGDIKGRAVSFYDDEHVILNVSETTRSGGSRREYEYTAAFSLDISDGSIKQIPRRVKGIYPAQSGLGRIIGQSKRPGWVLMPAFMGQGSGAPEFDLIEVSLKSGFGRQYQRGTDDTIDWFVDGHGSVLARERYDDRHDRYLLEWREGDSWKTIHEEEDKILPMSIRAVLPDRSGLVYVVERGDEGGFHAVLSLGSDGEIRGPLFEAPDREIDRVITDRSRTLVGVIYGGIDPEFDFLDPALKTAFDAVREQLPNATIYLDSWSSDRSVILYRVFDPGLGVLWLIQKTDTGDLKPLFNERPDIPGGAFGALVAIGYKASDGLDIPAVLTLPPETDMETLKDASLIVLPHGGPASYDRFDFDWMAQFFASRGYLVMQPNFRGSTGHGATFEDAGIGEFGGKMISDINDGVDALVRGGYVDPAHVCIVGASYGGYAALAGVAFEPDLYRCAVAIAPVTDLNRMLRDKKRRRGRDSWVIDYWADLMASGRAERDVLDAISPAKHADRIKAPVLLLHGDDDTVVDIDQSKVMASALKRADKRYEFIRLKGEDHWLSVAETRLQTLRAMDEFLKQHLPTEPSEN